MNKFRNRSHWVFLGLLSSYLSVSLESPPALAQLVPDNTLGTTVQTSGAIDTINGGFRAGGNLFHSFLEFNGAARRIVSFTDPGVSNILVRVTGGNPSTLNGQLAVNGSANLFLLNPNGILFGPRATLNVRGSFIAATANAIGFGEAGQFTAVPTDLPSPLTVQPSAFLFNQIRTASGIQSQGALRVTEGHSLLLVGGEVSLQGGQVAAPGGRVELGGLAQPGSIPLAIEGPLLTLSYPQGAERANLRLNQRALVDTRGPGGGGIQLQGREIVLEDFSRVLAETLGGTAGRDVLVEAEQLRLSDGSLISTSTQGAGAGGNLTVTVTGAVQASGVSSTNSSGGLFSEVFSGGAGGNLTINAGQLLVEGGSTISTAVFSTTAQGAGGNLTVHTADSVVVRGQSPAGRISSLTTATFGLGQAGNLTVNTGQFTVEGGATVTTAVNTSARGNGGYLTLNARDFVLVQGQSPTTGASTTLTAGTFGAGNAGDLTINTRQLQVQDGAQVSTSTRVGAGRGGNLTVNASEAVVLSRATLFNRTGLFSQANPRATSDAGTITVNTRDLLMSDGAWISTANQGSGQGGNIFVHADNLVQLTGVFQFPDGTVGEPTLITTDTITTGNAGNLILSARSLNISEGAQVSASTLGLGAGGDLKVVAGTVQLSGTSIDGNLPSGLFAASGIEGVRFEGSGPGGNLTVTADQIRVENRAQIAVSGLQTGQAGNLSLTARTIAVDSQGSITAATNSGEGGNITLNVSQIVALRRNSSISATAGGTGNGGNITISNPFLLGVASENSDIIANAFEGRGGKIQITTPGIFGLQNRLRLSPESDITASSEFGVSGIVQIQFLELDPTRVLTELPVNLVDSADQIAQSCAAQQQNNRFIITGRGGLSPDPTEAINQTGLWLGHTGRKGGRNAETPINESPPLIEANRWVLDREGGLALVADPEGTDVSAIQPSPCTIGTVP